MNQPPPIAVGVVTQAQGAHLPEFFQSLADTPEVGEVSLADDSGESFPLAQKLLGPKLKNRYRSGRELFRKESPPLALVTMEAARAPAEIDAALDAGCHVLSEKPGCVEPDDFRKLLRKAQSKHLQIMLALANRPWAPVVEARRLVRKGQLGRLYGIAMHLVADQARLQRDDYRNSWRGFKARAGGGHLAWLGIHFLDLAAHISGLQVERAAGFATVVGGQPMDVEDSAAVTLQYEGGVLGTLLSGFYLDLTCKEHVTRYQSQLQLWGEHGWLRLNPFEDQPLTWYSSRAEGPPRVQQFEHEPGRRSYLPFVRQAVRFAAGWDEQPPITGEEGGHVLNVLFACYRAAETGAAQEVR